jgi:hypothetical protein
LNRQRFAEINALHANSVYLESKEGIELLNARIRDINSRFDGEIQKVKDPKKPERDMEKIRKNPLMAAGLRGFERLKWQMAEGIDIYGKNNGR